MREYSAYRSPVRVFQDFGEEEFSSSSLKELRKRLLLELQISDDNFIHYARHSYSKNDVIQLFDAFSTEEDFNFYRLLAKFPELEYFLSNNRLNDISATRVTIDTVLINDEGFRNFVSPYLAYSIDRFLSETLKSLNFEQFERLIPLFPILLKEDAIFAFRKLNMFVETLEDRLDLMVHRFENFFKQDEFRFLCNFSFYRVANAVAKYYVALPNSIATDLINFSVNQQRHPSRSNYFKKMYESLFALDCEKDIRNLIWENYGAFKRNTLYQIRPKLGFRRWIVRSVVIAAIVFGFFSLIGSLLPDMDKSDYGIRKTHEQQDFLQENDYQRSERMAKIYRQQVEIGKVSPVQTTKFDSTSFRSFHDSILACIKTLTFTKSYELLSEKPQVISPLVLTDSTGILPFGDKAKFVNNTESDVLMIVRDRNVLSSHFFPAKSISGVRIDPGAFVFFYSGKSWNSKEHIAYSHATGDTASDSIQILISGHFEEISDLDFELLRKVYQLKKGSSYHLILDKFKGKYTIRFAQHLLQNRSRIY